MNLFAFVAALLITFPQFVLAFPIFPDESFKKYVPVNDSFIAIASTHHKIVRMPFVANITTTWTLRTGHLSINDLKLVRDAEQGIHIVKASINGVASPFSIERNGSRAIVTIASANVVANPTLVVQYHVPHSPASKLIQLGDSELLKIGRLVRREGALGWDMRKLAGASYGDSTTVSGEVSHAADEFVFSSNYAQRNSPRTTLLSARAVAGFFVGIAKKSHWQKTELNTAGTHFDIVTRKLGGHIPSSYFAEAVNEAWPRFQTLLPFNVPHAVVIDYDAILGGGPLGSYVVGVYSTSSIPPEQQDYIASATGWQPQPNTVSYIKDQYQPADNPMRDYVLDMVTHELGHLYFGFGLTSSRETEMHQLWFPLGIGVLYDRMIWRELRDYPSPVFSGTETQWRSVYATNPDIDQRLIEPDTTNDVKYSLPRTQSYAHGKSAAFLETLRERVGKVEFDEQVRSLIKRAADTLSYSQLRATLPLDVVRPVEADFQIGDAGAAESLQ